MKTINFVFGIHNHQPVGNFDFVFDEAFHHAYKPFIDVVEEFSEFKVSIHYSGILLEWIDARYQEHIGQLRRLVQQNQVEMLGGGYYEPILPVIPEADGLGQIKKLNQWLEKRFGVNPRGLWLAERVWEPTLPSLMTRANMQFTVIDDAHFRYAGLRDEQLHGYYITEDEGEIVQIFPISQKLRYTIPFQPPEVTIDYLRDLATEEGDKLIVFADDGEKFGVWPGTYPHVYEKGWLREFFKKILENSDWIRLMHFSEAMEKLKPTGRIYLPTCSYAEMMQWALPAKAYQEYEEFEQYLKDHSIYGRMSVFVRGGFWRNFLSKYPESNQMHKKMLYVSQQAWQLARQRTTQEMEEIFNNLWAGQCNCPYWHGVFGGLYLGHLRHAIYEKLIRAEKLIREMRGDQEKSRVLIFDFNRDGIDEVLVETPQLNLYFDLEQGGQLFELDYLPVNFNLLNTITRREEGYHQKLWEFKKLQESHVGSAEESDNGVASIHNFIATKEEDLEKYLIYDQYERKSLIDHFLPVDITIDKFASQNFQEEGNFVGRPYQLVDQKQTSRSTCLSFQRPGTVKKGVMTFPLTICKNIRIHHNSAWVDIEYQLETPSPQLLSLFFGVEFNFSLFAGDAPDRYYYSREAEINPDRLINGGELTDTHHLGIVDEYNRFKIDLESEIPTTIWYLPIETVSLSEAGFERVYQGSAVVLLYSIELNRSWKVKIQKKINMLP